MQLLTSLVVGLVTGLGASRMVRKTGLGIVGDCIMGIVGSVIGGVIARDVRIPISGIGGEIAMSLLGAVVLLASVRILGAFVK
jgi:uncharacterized membrane protein YeaQ/YmgE (transglycosylase-associated protein family)